MMWAAANFCFFDFFRSGEITVPTEKSVDHTEHLVWGNIAIDNTEDPQSFKVHLRRSKVYQLQKGVDAYIGKTDCPLCPVVAIMQYIAVRGPKVSPFFQFQDERSLTKALFTSTVREGLRAIGLPEQNFAGHSFRIEAATIAASVGIEDSVIRTMGRWSSSASLCTSTPLEKT